MTVCRQAVILAMMLYLCSSFLYYSKSLTCESRTGRSCNKWVANARMSHYLEFGFAYCFPENTYVLTQNGPTSMQQLQLGQQILGVDPETGDHSFSKVAAWLHRDTQSKAFFQIIETDKGLNFTASKLHNIAFSQGGKIDYAFARDLKPGFNLVTRDDKPLTVITSTDETEETGLFAPMTESGNYFVFRTGFDPNTDDAESEEMILVHAYSQVHHPQANLKAGLAVINAARWISYDRQPSDDQSFIHPLVGSCRWVFGSDWVQATQRIKVPTSYYGHQSHTSPTANHYYGVMREYGSHYRQISHQMGLDHDYYSSSSSYYYSDDYNRRQNERRKQQGMGLNLLFFKDIILY